jgi:transposase-like protein
LGGKGEVMKRKYRLEFKKMACELLDRYDNSPIRVARELSVPIKTYEKWVQSFKKNVHCFDEEAVNYEAENKLLRKQIKEREETIEMLKKVYAFFTEKERL